MRLQKLAGTLCAFSPLPLVIASSEYPREVTIEKLSDEVLLRIFHSFLDSFPRLWSILVHICRKWRHIVFGYHKALRLRLFCTHGTPVLKNLDCWPALPIVVEYGGSSALNPPSLEDEENVLAALKRPHRVHSIHLTVTKSLLEKISSIEHPFSELEDLVLLSQGGELLTLPSTFRWSTRLRRLHSTEVSFCTHQLAFYSMRGIVDLQLHDIDNYLFLKSLAETLSGLALQSLSIQVRSIHNLVVTPLSKKRIVELSFIPSLSRLRYRGKSKYLDSLLARLDAPYLTDVEIAFFNEAQFNLTNVIKFIDRTEMQKLHRPANILFSEQSASISLTQSAPTYLKFRVLCEPFGQQLSSMAQLCGHFFSLHLRVENICIKMIPSRMLHHTDSEDWVALLYSFNRSKRFHRARDSDPPTETKRPSRLSDGQRAALLPALPKLCICEFGSRYSPLREAVVSLMMDYRLSDHPIEVEYERPCTNDAELRTEPFSPQGTIEILSSDVLLYLFCHYVDSYPQLWSKLAHICQRWRYIIFASSHSLNLRLYCTYGTPVLRTLEFWPPLPLILNYGGSPTLNAPAPEDEKNIVAALKRSGQVRSISLTGTSSLVEKLSAISEPFTGLEEMTLTTPDNLPLTLPGTFRCGPHLRTLNSTRIAIPTLPQLLSPATSLVQLQLGEIPKHGYFCPEAFANALSEATHLEILSIHFLSLPHRRNLPNLSPSGVLERTVLSSLTRLEYRGTSKFLDNFVARIDAPRLNNIDITFSSQPTMDALQLGKFIERVEEDIFPYLRADVEISANYISISIPNYRNSHQLKIPCEQLDWQFSSMVQVCDQFSPFLRFFNILGISKTESHSRQGDVNGEQWLELFRAFVGTTSLYLEVTTDTRYDILSVLGKFDGGHTFVLPSLRYLYVLESLAIYGPPWVSLQSSLVARRLSGSPVLVSAKSYLCHICRDTFSLRQQLRSHLVSRHAYRIVCSCCGDFERSTNLEYGRYRDEQSFREHLKRKRVDISPTDTLLDPDLFEFFTELRPSENLQNWNLTTSYPVPDHGGPLH